MQPVISNEELDSRMARLTAPRVTIESITAKIMITEFIVYDTLTIAVVVMKNGFKVIGKAAPASAINFDPEVGKRIAYDDAIKQIWPLEGYLLCETLSTAD